MAHVDSDSLVSVFVAIKACVAIADLTWKSPFIPLVNAPAAIGSLLEKCVKVGRHES